MAEENDNNNKELTSAQARRIQEIAELQEKITKETGAQKELLEAQLEFLSALKAGDEERAEKAAAVLAGLKEQIKAQDELNQKLAGSAALGEAIGQRFFGLKSTFLGAALQAGSFSAAIGQTAAKIDEAAARTGVMRVSIDKLLSTTKDLVFALDQQQAAFVQNTGASREFAANAFQARSECFPWYNR
jgi:hypothetical protein